MFLHAGGYTVALIADRFLLSPSEPRDAGTINIEQRTGKRRADAGSG
jgi:hypothetical protein